MNGNIVFSNGTTREACPPPYLKINLHDTPTATKRLIVVLLYSNAAAAAADDDD